MENESNFAEKEGGDKNSDDTPYFDTIYGEDASGQALAFDVILAANYLDVKPLLDQFCKGIANQIKGKTPEQIRQTFNIKNDFTPEEEEQIRHEREQLREDQKLLHALVAEKEALESKEGKSEEEYERIVQLYKMI